MKVALLSGNFPPEFQGGTERVVLALARALQRAGEQVVVLTGSELPHDGRDVWAEHELGLPVRRIPRLPEEVYGLELSRPRVLEVLRGLLRDEAADVLHLHHWSTTSVGALRAARELGLGAVATLHDMWTACGRFFRRPPAGIVCPEVDGRAACGPCVHRSLPLQPVWKLRVGIADRDRQIQAELRAAHAITAPSRACAAAVARHAPWPGSVEVVPHGLLELPRAPVAGEHARGERLRVGTFGNLVVEKGVLVLVRAMAGVDPAELHLFGPFLEASFEREVRDEAARLGVALTCHGAFDPHRAHPARALDVAVFPSLCEETYGLVVEEALARGVPVVVSDLGALQEHIGDGGMVTRAGDVAALRQALRSLTDPDSLARLRVGVPTEFGTIEDAARRYVGLYRGALEADS